MGLWIGRWGGGSGRCIYEFGGGRENGIVALCISIALCYFFVSEGSPCALCCWIFFQGRRGGVCGFFHCGFCAWLFIVSGSLSILHCPLYDLSPQAIVHCRFSTHRPVSVLCNLPLLYLCAWELARIASSVSSSSAQLHPPPFSASISSTTLLRRLDLQNLRA